MGLSKVCGSRCLVDSANTLALRPLPIRDVDHCGDHLSGQSRTFDDLVSRHVADHQPEERYECLGSTAGRRPGRCCISCAGPWFALAATDWMALSRWTRLTGVERKPAQ